MKELRITKLVEQTEVTFVAVDNTEFTNQFECEQYERRLNEDKVKANFKRLNPLYIPHDIVRFFYGEDTSLFKVTLYNHADWLSLTDYLEAVEMIHENNLIEPTMYPHTTIVASGYDWVYDYDESSLREELEKALNILKGSNI
jgi:hypothetical protein